MKPTELANAGIKLYGRNWQTPLAKHLGVYDRTVRRWAAGDTPILRRTQEHIYLLLAADKLRTRTPGTWRRIPYGINLELVLCDGYPVALVHEHDASLVELLEHNE